MAKTINTIAERNIAAEGGIINLKVKVKVSRKVSFLYTELIQLNNWSARRPRATLQTSHV